jgi:hypothetical protein
VRQNILYFQSNRHGDGKMYKVVIEKKFVDGPLAGITIYDQMRVKHKSEAKRLEKC